MKFGALSIVLAALATSCLVLSALCLTQEIGEINRQLPDDQQLSYWGMYTEKFVRVKHEYKRLYPRGRLHTAVNAFWIAGAFLLLLSAVAAGLLKH
jgi:hypothetical protein